MEICLVRHGETDWNKEGRLQGHTDIPLNQVGIQQANCCAEFLKQLPYELVLTSPLLRAKQTAEVIAKQLNVPLIEMRELIERHYGDAEGLTKEERTIKFPEGNYTNQESRESLTTRVFQALSLIHEQKKDKKIIVVAHGAVINAILAALTNNAIGSGRTILGNACISYLQFNHEKWTVGEYNQVDHLKA